jgi:hypothetical protein
MFIKYFSKIVLFLSKDLFKVAFSSCAFFIPLLSVGECAE